MSPLPEIPATVHEMAMDGVVMKTRTFNVVCRYYGGDIAKVLDACRCEILNIHNVGRVTLRDLENCLGEYGRSLRTCRNRWVPYVDTDSYVLAGRYVHEKFVGDRGLDYWCPDGIQRGVWCPHGLLIVDTDNARPDLTLRAFDEHEADNAVPSGRYIDPWPCHEPGCTREAYEEEMRKEAEEFEADRWSEYHNMCTSGL